MREGFESDAKVDDASDVGVSTRFAGAHRDIIVEPRDLLFRTGGEENPQAELVVPLALTGFDAIEDLFGRHSCGWVRQIFGMPHQNLLA